MDDLSQPVLELRLLEKTAKQSRDKVAREFISKLDELANMIQSLPVNTEQDGREVVRTVVMIPKLRSTTVNALRAAMKTIEELIK